MWDHIYCVFLKGDLQNQQLGAIIGFPPWITTCEIPWSYTGFREIQCCCLQCLSREDLEERWTAEKLSYSGIVQLVLSMISGIQVYESSVMLLPKKVLPTIRTLITRTGWFFSRFIDYIDVAISVPFSVKLVVSSLELGSEPEWITVVGALEPCEMVGKLCFFLRKNLSLYRRSGYFSLEQTFWFCYHNDGDSEARIDHRGPWTCHASQIS
ncbi:hypothetical protein Ancab_021870 [Ancistrocladus abbreviatus]